MIDSPNESGLVVLSTPNQALTPEAPEAPMNDTNPDKTRRPAPHGCRCGARWSGSAMAHCAVCHRTFGGISGFDKHRAGTKDRSQRAGECTNPAEIGYAQNDRGTWVAPNDGAYDFATRAASDE